MNANEFSVSKSTVISTNPTNTGTEIWTRDNDGCETSYLVNDHSIRSREGHNITAITYGNSLGLDHETTVERMVCNVIAQLNILLYALKPAHELTLELAKKLDCHAVCGITSATIHFLNVPPCSWDDCPSFRY